ncbi:hypothetical protein JKP88DRAFT_306679 [Tribonema minus]|uniref:Uncharacterized protein n=1 Tax=Tribonema minus TaxID=303371 RepID=A0A836CJF4_9STRA|nr:hypothetical protein JKP88DRAFT_306679 [Tribonema minus]
MGDAGAPRRRHRDTSEGALAATCKQEGSSSSKREGETPERCALGSLSAPGAQRKRADGVPEAPLEGGVEGDGSPEPSRQAPSAPLSEAAVAASAPVHAADAAEDAPRPHDNAAPAKKRAKTSGLRAQQQQRQGGGHVKQKKKTKKKKKKAPPPPPPPPPQPPSSPPSLSPASHSWYSLHRQCVHQTLSMHVYNSKRDICVTDVF